MHRSTVAALGTITGAALIVAVRLSVPGSPSAGEQPGFDLSAVGANPAELPPADDRSGRAGAGESTDPTPPSSRGRGSGSGTDDESGTDDNDKGRGDEGEKESGEKGSGDKDKGDKDKGEKGKGEKGKDGDEESRDRDGGDGDAGAPSKRPKPPASGLNDGRFVGRPVSHQFGTVQVAVTISDGKITRTSVNAPTEGISGVINSRAVPTLKQETLQAQSARVDAVSGATLTSQAYVTSLQAAVDQARA